MKFKRFQFWGLSLSLTMKKLNIEKNDIESQLSLILKEMKKFNSLKYRVLIGIVQGFGSVIGATVIVSIAVFILSQIASHGISCKCQKKIINFFENSFWPCKSFVNFINNKNWL